MCTLTLKIELKTVMIKVEIMQQTTWSHCTLQNPFWYAPELQHTRIEDINYKMTEYPW